MRSDRRVDEQQGPELAEAVVALAPACGTTRWPSALIPSWLLRACREEMQQPLLEDGRQHEKPRLALCAALSLALAAVLVLVAAAAMAALLLRAVGLSGYSMAASSQPPFCRKSSSIAVLPRDAAAHGRASGQPALDMVAWSGMGEPESLSGTRAYTPRG